MTDKELRKLRRADLLEIMIAQSKEIDRLRMELKKTKIELAENAQNSRSAGTSGLFGGKL